jgi:hypothetical protein
MSEMLIQSHYQERWKVVLKAMRSQDELILSNTPEEIAEYYVNEYGFNEVQIDKTKEYITESLYRSETVNTVHGPREEERLYKTIEVPVMPNENIKVILSLLPSRQFTPIQNVQYVGGYLKIVTTAQTMALDLETLHNNLDIINEDIRKGNKYLSDNILREVNKRKSLLQNTDEMMQQIASTFSIKLVKRADISSVIPVAVQHKEQLKPILSSSGKVKQVVLERKSLNSILHLIVNCGLMFERTPCTFSQLKEKPLRDVILSSLNAVFEGAATGEAFSNNGKTDVHLVISQGNNFIAECKNWDGEVKLEQTVNQILGYLTWRESYGVVILFSRKVNFTEAIDNLAKSIQSSSTYVGGFQEIGKSHFIGLHKLPTDDKKQIEIHYLMYDLHCKKSNKV